MNGLIIKREWLDLIISGKKTMEIRGSDTRKIGETIYLLESGSGRVRGTCKIAGSRLMTWQNWDKERVNHCVNISFLELNKIYHTAYGWILENVQPIEEDVFYKHPKGAVIWVKDVEAYCGGKPFYMDKYRYTDIAI